MNSKKFMPALLFFILASVCYAVDDYKPYLHTVSVPDSPEVRLFGQYSTNLFPGSATYNYPIEVPKGVNGLAPTVFAYYNSQNVKGRPSVFGAGWNLNQDLIYTDVNSTVDDTSDDKFIMVLDGNLYELVYLNGEYKTEVDYWFKIEKNTNNWVVTKQNGKKYKFGYVSDNKWHLSFVNDTHGNEIYYSYLFEPNAEDSNAVYLDKIEYNHDKERVIDFSYEKNVRSDRRRLYSQGSLFEESRRLTDISVIVDDELLRRHYFSYSSPVPSLSYLTMITLYGSDNTSILYNISFDYYGFQSGYANSSLWNAPVSFQNGDYDNGVRLLDVNNDGFVDVLQSKSGAENVWLNDKISNWSLSSWEIPEYFVSSDAVPEDEGVRFADVNRDGYVDILKSKASDRQVYVNTGDGFENSTMEIPLDFVDSSGIDLGVRVVDINGDGYADLLKSKTGDTDYVYMNDGDSWESKSWTMPVDFIDSSSKDLGIRLVDVNGDGLVDILQGTSSTKNAWLFNGTGWIEYSDWQPPVSFINSTNGDIGVRILDINSDGLLDIVEQDENAWLNTGSGFVNSPGWTTPVDFVVNGKNTGRRLADVNGDGFVDVIVSEGSAITYLKNFSLPYVMESITNEYGGVVDINYTTSTQFDNDNLGFNIFVVNEVDKNNSLIGDFNTFSEISYNYSGGKYDYDKQEFRGFSKTTETDSDSVVEHYFYQDDARRGKEYKTEIYDISDNLYFKNTKNYNYTYANGIYNLSLISSTDYNYDGAENPVIHNISYSYNVFGNPQFVIDHGDASITGDEKYYNYSYGFNFKDWIIDKVSRVTAYDENMQKVKETKYYYDDLGLNGVGRLGELTKTESWLEEGNNTYTHFDYDSVGNLVYRTDSLGNTYQYRYDNLNIFIDSIINPLGHVQTFSYDAFGNLLYEEKNGIRTTYEYDVFGRIQKEIQPYDSCDLPTKEYEYDFDGSAPEKITVSLKTTSNNTDDINFFYDGFANLIQIKTEVEDDQEIVKNIFYDEEFRIDYEQNPYFDTYTSGLTSKSTTANITSYTYDSMSRVVLVVNPDGTNKTVEFNQYNITDYDENGHKHKYTLDAHDRITKVIEYNQDPLTGLDETYETNYEYDTNNNLIGIVDNENNEFQFFYDALSRKTKMIDPDMGTWEYEYDANGNLIKQTDNKDNEISLEYDALNRITEKKSSDVNISFNYDIEYYGTLSNIFSTNYNFSYDYDDRLRVVKEIQNISGIIFENNLEYDSQNRIISNNGLDYEYNKQGLIDNIAVYITSSDYNAFGSITNKNYANNKNTTYTYDSENNRLTSITTPSVMVWSYQYDSVGNVMQITDALTPRTYKMSYDSLNRLVNATIGNNTYLYSFNSIGNMKKQVENDNAKRFVYDGLAHAPSKIVEGTSGVDIHNPHELDTDSKTRVFEFYLVNEKSTNITANFTMNFGDGNSDSSSNFNISDSAIVLIEHNYSHGGDYDFNITAQTSSNIDYDKKYVKFGTYADGLDLLFSNITRRTFELLIGNDVSEKVENVNWNCSENLYSFIPVNISGLGSESNIIDYIYSSPGRKIFECNVTSDDGIDSISKDFTIRGLEVEEYDVLHTNISTRVIEFKAKNYYNDLESNIKISTNGETFNQTFNISENDEVFVITETNYSSDGAKTYEIDFTSNDSTTSHVERFNIRGVSIENYVRVENNYTNQVLMFDVLNNWRDGEVSWNLSNPDMNATINLSNGESVAVIIENTYTEQGNNKAEIKARSSSYVDLLTDFFVVLPLQIIQFEALTSNIFEIQARNNLNSTQIFDWQLDNITSDDTLNITNDDAFIIIEQDTPSGVNVLTATINSSTYQDSENEAVII